MKKTTTELRCYTWTIFQLSSIQQGIQAGHAAIELVAHSTDNLVREWATQWKTLICLNGGTTKNVLDLIAYLSDERNPYSWAKFVEAEDFLAGITTSVAIVLPERVFKLSPLLNTGTLSTSYDRIMGVHRVMVLEKSTVGCPEIEEYDEWEWGLIERLAASPLAR